MEFARGQGVIEENEELREAIAHSQKQIRTAVDWVQNNSRVLIAAGLGLATVGLVTFWLSRKNGLSTFFEEESSPTVH